MLRKTVPNTSCGESLPRVETTDHRWSTLDSRVRRTIGDESEAERRRLRASRSVVRQRSSTRYDGAVPCRELYTRTASLKSIIALVLSEMAAETGNACIFETMWGTVKIPTTNLGYKTMYRCKIMLASKYNSDRQPEISIRLPKPEIITSLEFLQIASKFKRQIRNFRWWQLY